MINLLPLEYKKTVKKEYARRFVAVFGLLFSIIVLVEIVCCLVLLFWLDSSLAGFQKELEFTKKMSKVQRLEGLDVRIDELNRVIALYKDKEEKIRPFSVYIEEVLRVLPASVSVNSFVLGAQREEGSQMNFSGHAATRSDLLAFIGELEKIPFFTRVESPLSNLLAETDVDFLLIVDLGR